MSDHFVVLIPTQPAFVPTEAAQTAAAALARAEVPGAEDIRCEVERVVVFQDCGENFERVRCPNCSSEVLIDLWQDWMTEDWSENEGFRLHPRTPPCCGIRITLNDLAFHWPQGFSRFSLTVVNPESELSDEAFARIGDILGCDLRVIRRKV